MKLSKVLSFVLYVVGFVLFVVCMSRLHAISETSPLFGFGASFGTLLITTAINNKDDM